MEAIHKPLTRPDTCALRVSRFDQVASLLVTLLILAGVTVIGMFLVWLTATLVFHKEARIDDWFEIVAGPGDPKDDGGELELPGFKELPELAEPQIEPTTAALTAAVSTVAAIDVESGPSQDTGPNRTLGPPGGPDIIPKWERWEIRFESSSIKAYARQLDHFKIELGAAGGGRPKVDYAFNLTKARPDSKRGSGKDEQRLYMTWRGGTLRQFDRHLLGQAGIDTTNRLLLQFYPKEVEQALAQIEKEQADKRGKTAAEYLKTIFGVEPSEGGWKFIVLEQRFRPAPK